MEQFIHAGILARNPEVFRNEDGEPVGKFCLVGHPTMATTQTPL